MTVYTHRLAALWPLGNGGDWLTTYVAVIQGPAVEVNHIFRYRFEVVGFWPAIILNLTIATALAAIACAFRDFHTETIADYWFVGLTVIVWLSVSRNLLLAALFGNEATPVVRSVG